MPLNILSAVTTSNDQTSWNKHYLPDASGL